MAKIKDDEKENVLTKIVTFIVDKRNLFFLIFIVAGIFSIFSSNWVQVENDLTTYLPETTQTRQGLDVMNREFITYATADVMVSNISYARAETLADELEESDGVSGVEFDNTNKHFKGADALFTITFKGDTDAEVSKNALAKVKEHLKDYDTYISTEVGFSMSESLANDMKVIVIIVAIIILAVLLFTSKAYAEVISLILTFGAAALLNMGTNFLLGKISFVSNSVAVVLQLALAIDYAIILCRRFSEEHEDKPAREAMITTLSKAILEISSSSLTTISGLLALATMQFQIGPDLAIVLVKAIFLSLLSVFLLMPGLLMITSKWIDKTQHKNLVPEINMVGKFVVKTKKIVPPILLVLAIIGCVLSNMCPYVYGTTTLTTPRKDQTQIAKDKIHATFQQTNLIALVVPSGDYKKEAKILDEVAKMKGVDHTQGLANTEAKNGYMLTDEITARQFSEIADVDFEAAKLLYAAYAVEDEDYGEVITNLDSYSIPLIDVFLFLHDEMDKKYVTLDDDLTADINELYDDITDAKKQLESDDFSRLLVVTDLPEEGEETFAFVDKLGDELKKYYPKDTYVVGNSTSDSDLANTFKRDNIIISVLSALFVIIVLLFTYQSVGLPILLILVIQSSIWINFSFPFITNSPLYFLGYLIVSSIQMGANIDYAIVISGRYNDLKQTMPPEKAIVTALNQAFPTIITSGAILACAGFIIRYVTTNGIISSLGLCIGRGTLISIVLVMCVLPQILILGDKLIERTSFSIKKPNLAPSEIGGTVYVNGWVRGKVSGVVNAKMRGVIIGDVNAMVDTDQEAEANAGKLPPEPKPLPASEESKTNEKEAENHEEH